MQRKEKIYIPEIEGNAQAMEVIAEFAAKLPEMEMQDKPARPFPKTRLAEKKAQVAGQGRESKENTKNRQREM